jgi:hypothetical protein
MGSAQTFRRITSGVTSWRAWVILPVRRAQSGQQAGGQSTRGLSIHGLSIQGLSIHGSSRTSVREKGAPPARRR